MINAASPVRPRYAVALLALLLAACGGGQPAERAALEIRGTDPSSAPTAPVQTADGIVLYDGYAAARAQDGDTVGALAGRLGLSSSELAAYNGLSPSSPLRAGQELALPPRPGGYATGPASPVTASAPLEAPSPDARTAAIESGTIEAETLAATTGTEIASADPLATTAPPLDLSSGSAGAGSTWSPELAADAIERSASEPIPGSPGTPGTETAVGQPPSAGSPLPADPAIAPDLPSPDLSTYQTARTTAATDPVPLAPADTSAADSANAASPAPAASSAGGGRLARPVDGPVAVGFQQGSGSQRIEGVEFGAPAGASVVAAEDGEVALVSEALGGLGTIVLIRHRDELLTVYGKISDVRVAKGDVVSRGQQIGAVAEPDPGRTAGLHFEVREGANSVDPMSYL